MLYWEWGDFVCFLPHGRFLAFSKDSHVCSSFWFFIDLCFFLQCEYKLLFICPFCLLSLGLLLSLLCSVKFLKIYKGNRSECWLQRRCMILNNLSRKWSFLTRLFYWDFIWILSELLSVVVFKFNFVITIVEKHLTHLGTN